MYGSTHVQVDSVLTTVPMKMPTMPNGLARRLEERLVPVVPV